MHELKIAFNIPLEYISRARYIFNLLSDTWGIPISFTNKKASADVYYSTNSEDKFSIKFNEKSYLDSTRCNSIVDNNSSYWTINNTPLEESDHIGIIFRLINLLDEKQIKKSERDNKGIFKTTALPETRQKLIQIPIIENHAQYLLEKILAIYPQLNEIIIPRWPENKKYVVCVSHDTDAVDIGALKELITNFGKYALRGSSVHGKMVKLGLKHFSQKALTNNPFFGFPKWQSFEEERSLKSCFYLHLIPKGTKQNINDCKSNVLSKKMDWDLLIKMQKQGWEFGIHAAINAKNSIDAFIRSKEIIERKLESPIFGIRHHYFALDWENPYKTFRKHVNAGFRYDTSIAWQDKWGYRSAIGLPYQPYDLMRDKPLDMYEIPAILMDGHLTENFASMDEYLKEGIKAIELAKSYGNILMLDWHTETSVNEYIYKNYLTLLSNILSHVDEQEVWYATPFEIVKHWHQRRKKLTQKILHDK